MNLFNRFVVSLLALTLMAVASLILAVATGLTRPDDLLRLPWSLALEPARLAEGAEWRWLVGVSAGLIPVALVLFISEWSTLRQGPRELTVKHAPGGAVTVAIRSVRELADRLGSEHPGVLAIRTRVRERRKGLQVVGVVSVDPNQPLPDVAEELQARIKSGIERHIGRAVAEVRVKAQIGPLSNGRSSGPRVQ